MKDMTYAVYWNDTLCKTAFFVLLTNWSLLCFFYRYYSEGEYQFDVNEREKDKIISFMKDPKEPPPPPPPEPQWADVVSEVNHLTDESFKNFVKKKKHTLVMFYAPCEIFNIFAAFRLYYVNFNVLMGTVL